MANTPPIILTDARYLDEQTAEFLAQAKKIGLTRILCNNLTCHQE